VARLQGIRDGYEVGGRRIMRRVARTLLRPVGSIDPNAVTVTGTVLNGVAAWLAFHESFLAAAIVFLIGSLMDALDGAVAKVTGRVSAFGGFLDSTLDRVSEGLVLGGIALMFANRGEDPSLWPIAACFVAVACSYLVSYTRAKAESLGVQCKGGLASRTERVVVLTAGLLLATWWETALEVAVYVLAVTAALTVVQRVLHVHRSLPDGRKPRRRRPSPRRHRNVQPDPEPIGGEPPG
jgi:CDP-diacylglycerol--glycerol-3-phosphate 3-phosphatidyltransferase